MIAGMDMTPKREQQVSFSQPYYEGLSAVVVTRKGAYHTFADLKGKKSVWKTVQRISAICRINNKLSRLSPMTAI